MHFEYELQAHSAADAKVDIELKCKNGTIFAHGQKYVGLELASLVSIEGPTTFEARQWPGIMLQV